jgi:hypothetical protein
MPVISKYPLPPILNGICDAKAYHKWLECKADALQKRDKQLNRPCAWKFSQAQYKEKIHNALLVSDGTDPYTGDRLRLDLMGKWDENANRPAALARPPKRRRKASTSYGAVMKEFFLLPVADHIDPDSDELEFEICSWIVNEGKSQQTPEEYVTLCKKVADGKRGRAGRPTPA